MSDQSQQPTVIKDTFSPEELKEIENMTLESSQNTSDTNLSSDDASNNSASTDESNQENSTELDLNDTSDSNDKLNKMLNTISNSDNIKYVFLNYNSLRTILNNAKKNDKNAIESVIEINSLMQDFLPHLDQDLLKQHELELYNVLHNKKS